MIEVAEINDSTTFESLFTNVWNEVVGENQRVCSPYHFAKVVSELVGREIRPQMMYNYAKKGYLPTSTNSTNKKEVHFDIGYDFTERFVSKNGQIPEITNLVQKDTEE